MRYYFDPNNDGKAIRGITTKVDGKLHTFTCDGSMYYSNRTYKSAYM